jgi:hypothetical protein
MTARYVPNPNLAAQLGSDPTFRRMLLGQSIAVKKNIPENLPTGKSGGRRVAPFGKRSFAEVEGVGRAVHGVVGTRWRLGPIIEWGSINSPAYGVLRKSVLQAGLRFVPRGRG